MASTWVVLLEVECLVGTHLRVETVEALLKGLGDRCPSGLHASDRCAVQFLVEAAGPEAALTAGIELWTSVARDVGFPPVEVVRAEVKTPAELDAEYDEDAPGVLSHVPADARATTVAYLTTRRLLQARTPREVVSVVQALIRRLGGVVVPPNPGDPRILDVDLSLAAGPPMAAAAEPYSVARLCLEEVLPAAVEDARRVIMGLRAASASPLPAVQLD